MISIIQVCKLAVEKGASDVHITVGAPPMLRVNGDILKVNTDPLKDEEVKQICYSLLSDNQKAEFEKKKSLDFSFLLKGICRFRGNLFYQKGSVAVALRVLNKHTPSLEDLGAPPIVETFTDFPHGLVLVTGATGSGKSTTLAACIDKINQNKSKHILTIEDPIEMIYQHKKSIINQREVGVDCDTFASGLRVSMRVDPDVILVGEIRDSETAEVVLALAETGHLVFSTLHTNTAPKTIDRLIGMFGSDKRGLIRNQLSTVLQAVVSQILIPSLQGGRSLATEIMVMNPAIRNLVREEKIYQIHSAMQTSSEQGSCTLNKSLANLIKDNAISEHSAFEVTPDKQELYRLLGKRKFAA